MSQRIDIKDLTPELEPCVIFRSAAYAVLDSDCAKAKLPPRGGWDPAAIERQLAAQGYDPNTSPGSPRLGSCCDHPKT